MEARQSRIPAILRAHEQDLLAEWGQAQKQSVRSELLRDADLQRESQEFLRLLTEAAQGAGFDDTQSRTWDRGRDFLEVLSRSRGLAGFTPSETAAFVFSLKPTLFARVERELADDPAALVGELLRVNTVLDALGLFTTESYQKSREEVIIRQQQDMLELSTPVVQLWQDVLALPLIGTLDSARTQVVMETLLQRIVETSSTIAIIDITGVPTVDTLVAQHLLKTVTAARLMGAECIISGIRPQIAATIVHLGVDLGNIVTKASLADAFSLALRKSGYRIQSQS